MSVRVFGPGGTIEIGRPLRGVRLGGSASYDADASALFAAMSSQPDATRKTLINTTILALKAAGIWTLLDELWFMAAHDSQAGLLGWKRKKDCTAVNAPTFTADRGYAGDGTTSYLNANFVPSTDGVQYTQNDASFGIYSRTNSTATAADMGTKDSGSNISTIHARYMDNNVYGRINSLDDAGVATASSLGLTVVRRTGSAAKSIWRNGVSLSPGTTASSGVAASPFYIGARDDNGAAQFLSARQYAMAFVGASMSTQQQLDLFTITEAHLDAIGAGVI